MGTSEIIFQTIDTRTAKPLPGVLLSSVGGPGPWQGVTDARGEFRPHLSPAPDYSITFSKAGYTTRTIPANINGPGDPIVVGLDRAVGILPAIHVEGREFVTATGARHLVIGSTELMLAWRYDLEGADAIRPVLAQRQALGFNNLRVLWQDYNNIGHAWLMPLEKIPAFVLLLAEYGFYTEGCILADAQLINPDHSTQAARVAAVYDVTAGLDSVFTQLGNEWEKNGYDPGRFARPADGRICTNASAIENGQDAPYWDYFTFSGQRSPLNHAIREYGPIEFMYGDAGTRPHGPMPAICGEGMKPGVNADDPRDFERAGAQARSGCGGRYHTVSGTGGNSCLFTELEDTCGRAFVRGLAGGDA